MNENSTNQEIKYAPRQKVLKGTLKLACIGIKYRDINRHSKARECKSMGVKIAKFYKRNSRGLLDINVSAHLVSVPLQGKRKNVRAAEKMAMNKIKNKDLYAIASIFTNNHAGGKVAHLAGTLASTGTHEVGHLLGLGHAGAYENGKKKLDYYGDG